MIYILTGNNVKKKNAYLKKLSKNDQLIFIFEKNINKSIIFDYANSVSLFGVSPLVVVENLLKNPEVVLSQEELDSLRDSKTVIVLLEEKLLAPEVKKFKKYATIEDFSSPTTKKIPKMNVFNIAEAFARRDKIGTWVLYREAVSLGVAPEEISGIIFWKIKMMILNGTKVFSGQELKSFSSNLVDLYHRAHRGECDFTIGLEQFILSSLNK